MNSEQQQTTKPFSLSSSVWPFEETFIAQLLYLGSGRKTALGRCKGSLDWVRGNMAKKGNEFSLEKKLGQGHRDQPAQKWG